MSISFDDILKAAEQIEGVLVRTPCSLSQTLSTITGAEIYLKFENLQFTAAFKERGALVKLLSLTAEERQKGIIAMSAGNHAQAVAHHAKRFNIPTTIVMPKFTPHVKVERTREAGATVILEGDGFDDTSAYAIAYAQSHDLLLVHPYDDPLIIAGQGTTALEMLEDHPDLDTMILPIGGGGLISGCAVAAKHLKPSIEIVGVETSEYPSMYQALNGMEISCGKRTMADGIAVKQPGKIALEIIKAYVQDILLVDEVQIEEAVLHLFEVEKTVVEGAGAVGLAAIYAHKHRFQNKKVGIILSGGNIDMMILSSIIERGLIRSGRLTRLTVELRDVPGGLSDITRCLADEGANVVEVHHHRTFVNIPLQSVEVEFVIQTRGLDHVTSVIQALKNLGYISRVEIKG
jgi:threonine dehydratase